MECRPGSGSGRTKDEIAEVLLAIAPIAGFGRAGSAVARSDWCQAETMTAQAHTALRKAGLEDSHLTSLVCALQARMALRRGDAQAARQQLVRAQRAAASADLRNTSPGSSGTD